MPIYRFNSKVYDIPDDVVKDFEKDRPTATIAYKNGEDIYDIQVNQREQFLKQFPEAELYEERANDIAQVGGVTQAVDTTQGSALMQGESTTDQAVPDTEIQRLKNIQSTAQQQIDNASFFDRFFDADTRAAVATRNKAEEALEVYDEANREKENWFDRNVVGAFKGFVDKVGDLSTWDMGASGLASAKALNDAYTKWENGEKLTTAEQNMLDAYGLATAVQAAYQDKVGTAYNVGGSLPESLAFGASLAINPAGGAGKKLAESAAKAAVKKYGTSFVSKLAKGAARVGGDVLEMGVATAVPGAGRVAEDYYNRLNGQSTFEIDDNGIIRYGGQQEQEEADDAIWKAFGSQFIENYSEAMGNYFAPMGSVLSNLTSKGLKAAHLGKLADVVNDISSSQFSKSLQRFKDATKFDGLVGEYLEEVAGNVMNAATVGDMNFNSPDDPRSVFNPETNIETFLSCALLSGTMYAVEAPISMYNKNVAKKNLTNADIAASKVWDKDRWDDLRSQMDEADPQLLAQLLTGVQNATDLNDEQKQAAKDYGMRLMQFQGYNARRMQNTSESTSDANEINNAYDDGADIQAPYDKHSAKVAADRAEASLGEDAEFNQAVISGAETPVATINAMAESGKYTEEQIQKAKDYYVAINRMNGMTDALLDEVDAKIESANVEVDMNTNKDLGQVIQVTLRDGSVGYVVQGSVNSSEDGSIDVNNSDDTIMVRLQNGEVKMMNPGKDLRGVTWTETPDALKDANNNQLRMNLIDQGIAEIDWNPATPNPKVGDAYVVDGVPTTIVGEDGKGGLYVVPTEKWQEVQGNEIKLQQLIEQASQNPIPVASFKQWASDQLDAQEEAQMQQEQAETSSSEIPNNQEEMLPAEQPVATTEEGVAVKEESVQQVVPTKEDGSIDFVAYGIGNSLKELGNAYGEKMPHKVEVTAKAFADDLIKAQKAIEKAQEDLDNAPIGRDAKQKESLEKARIAYEEVKKEADFWAEMDADIKKAQEERESLTNPKAELDLSDEPMTTEEFIAKALADGGIRLTADSYKKELGYGEKERKKFLKMFAKAENGGVSVERAGEWLMQWDSENGTNFFDQEDANAGRDALINFLGSVRTWGDITGYIRRNREQLAERESEGLRNEVESAIDANYHMTPEEYATLQEVESVENPFGGLDVATKDAIFVEAYEEYEQSLNPKQNDEGRTSEISEGNGVVLPEERTDNEGGTSERQGERPDLSEGAVQQNDAAQEAEQVEEPITIQEGESPVAFAERVLEEQRRKPLRNRANEWAKALGVKVHFIERLEDVENQAAYLALSNGSKVAGWYEGATGEVFLYMPNLDNIAEVDKTYIHEVVAHKGLREMLGKERFNELCDKVWDMMPDKEKAKFIRYPEVNGDTRAAADEYIAYLAEKENLTPQEQTIWDSIVKMFRDMLDKALNGIIGKSKLTDKDISDLIKASYANLKSGAELGVSGDGTRFRTLEQINSEFNENLQKQIEGALPNGYIYQLGSPSAVLRSAGIEDLPIELAASRLVDKSMQDNHPFELSEVENLPEAIHNPLAVFVSATKVGSNVILTELKHDGKNFVAALRVRPNKKRIEVNQIRSLYPKNTNGIIDWINNGLATYVDKERMAEWVEKQRNELLSKPQSNSVEVREQLVSATKIVNDFENPTLPEEKSLFRVVYHGSAASFDKFSKDFIGSGEGNSVAGYGFYVTSDDSVGRYYADFSSKSKRKVIQPEGYTVNGELVKDSALVNAYNLLKENEFDVEKSISYVEERIEQKKKEPKKGIFGSTKLYENMLVYLQKEQDNPGTLGYQEEVIEQPGRYLFEVEIPDDNGKNYLDLDKSVPKNVKEKAKEKLLEYLYNGEDAEYWENNKSIIEEQWKLVEKKGATAETLRSTMQEIVGREEVSDIFSSMGYIGFKTSEDSERGTTYVIFDESNLNIVNHTRFRVKGISGLKPLEVADKIKDCFYEDVAKSDRIAMVEYLQQNESGKAVIDRMYQHNGTGWARQTANATFVRIALNDLIEGREPSVQSMLTRGREHPVVKYIKQLGKEGVWRYIQTFGLLGEAGKPVNNVNGSFLSCNPSNECAKYCYATKGNYIYAGSSVKSELVYWCIANDPIRAAQRIVDEYKSKPQYYEGKALRLFDKGDIDMAWIPVIEELNKQGVVTQVFSKRPEILERVDKGLNVVMMSIDSSNSDMLDEYPTMPVALVYRGNVDSELLEKCKDRLQQYGGVILPVKIGQKLLSENEVKSLPLWTRPYQCPIDNGKRQINDKENPERSWNCTKCDKNGGVGCFFHRTANKLRKDRYENETKSTSGRTERDNQRSSSRNAESSNGGSVPLHSTNGAVGDIEFRRELLRTLRESLAEGGLSDADITPKLLETLDRRLRGMLEGRGTQSSSSTLSTNSLEESREIGQGYERGDRPESDSRIKSEGGTRFRISNQNQEIFAHEPAIDYVSQANDVVEVPRDEVMYTMNNIASQLYKTSGRFMRQLYQNGTLGRVLKGDYAEIDQIKAKNEYDHAKPILDEYLNELVWMKYQATDAAQEVINGVISDVEYAIKYYKDLSLGKDVWRTEERPRFRIVEKQREDVNKGVDSFTSKYNSKPVSVASSDMTDEELEKAVPTSLVEDTRKAFEEGVKGKYSVKADKIYIFADNVTKEELEDTLFHENLHHILSGKPMVEEFYNNFNEKHPEQVKGLADGYKESDLPEEVFVIATTHAMMSGRFDIVNRFLSEESKNELLNILKDFGYDYEQERTRRIDGRTDGQAEEGRTDVAEGKEKSERRGRSSDEASQREGVQGRGLEESGSTEGTERSNARTKEQAEQLRDLFGRVADMGLDGVLGNGEYTSLMADIYKALPEDVRKEVDGNALRYYGGNVTPAVSDYIVADGKANILDKVVGFIKEALRKVEFDLDLTQNDVKYLLWRSKKPLKRYDALDVAEDIDAKRSFGVDKEGGTRFRSSNAKQPFDPSDRRAKIVKEYDSFLKTGKFNFIEAFQDRMYSVKVFMDMIVKATGKKVRDFEDAYKAENQLGSINKPAEEKYLKNFYKPLVETIRELSEKYGREAIERYIYCKSGLERNEVLRQRDADEAYNDAKAELDDKLAKNQITQAQYNTLLQQADAKRQQTLAEDVDYSGIRGMLYNMKAQAINKDYEEGRIDKATRDARLDNLEANKKAEVHDWKQFAENQVATIENQASSAELNALWKKINAATNETLRIDYESGMIDKSTYDAEKAMMKYYVPLRNWADTTAEEMYEYRSELVRPVSSNQKRAKGRESQADDPIATIALMAQNAIVRGNRNKVKQTFYAFVANRETGLASVRDVWYVRDQNGDWVPQYADTTQAKDAAEFAQILQDFETDMQLLEAQGDAYKGKLPQGMKFRANRQQKMSHVVAVMINGKEYAVYVNGNPRPAQAINGETNSEAANASAWYDKLKRIYGAGLTSWNPDFIIPNMIRDGIHATTMTMIDAGPFAAARFALNGPKAFAQVFAMVSGVGKNLVNPRNQAYFEEFVANGGETGYTAINTLEDYKKEYDKLMKEVKGLKGKNLFKNGFEAIGKWLEAANRIFEDVNRFNAYISARESGESIMRSVDAAKNITVNFNRKGALSANSSVFGTIANAMSKWILFFNPAVQGIAQLVTKTKMNPGRAIAMSGTILSSGFVMPMLNEILVAANGGDDEDDYWNQSDFKRRNNWMLFTGDGYVSVPLPPVLRELYGIGDIIYGSITGHITPERAAMDMARQVQSAIGFVNLIPEASQEPDMVTWAKGFAPDLASPVLDVISNTNFMGRPIAKWTSFNEYDPEYERVYKGVSPLWVELSKLLNEVGGNEGRRSDVWGNFINPAMMEHLFNSYGGGIGKTINNLSGMIWDGIKGNTENLDPYRKSPILPRFYTPNDEKTVVPAINRKYYDYEYMFNTAKKALKNYQEGVKSKEHPEYQKYIDEMKENGEIQFIKFFEQESKRLKKIQNLIKGDPSNKKELEERMIDMKADIATKCYEMLN